MTHVTCRLTAKNRDQLRNPTLGNRIWATFTFFHTRRQYQVNLFLNNGSSTIWPNSIFTNKQSTCHKFCETKLFSKLHKLGTVMLFASVVHNLKNKQAYSWTNSLTNWRRLERISLWQINPDFPNSTFVWCWKTKHPTAQFFTGRMPFLPPNQQRQSTEGNTCTFTVYTLAVCCNDKGILIAELVRCSRLDLEKASPPLINWVPSIYWTTHNKRTCKSWLKSGGTAMVEKV